MRQLEVLVVDDDATILHSVVGTLRDYYHLSIAKTRAKALEILVRKNTDIVLLDVNLPDGSGFDICAQILSDSERYGTPAVLFMTAQNDLNDEAKGLQLGASDYISKPIHPVILKARVKLQAELIWRTEELENLSRIDGLTGVNNRRAFDEALEKYISTARRSKITVGLALIDIDHFKLYNDFYGHQLGDLCLRRFAEVLLGTFKRGTDFVARYGGEEFTVVIADTSENEMKLMCARFVKALNELAVPHAKSPTSKFVTCSIGACVTVCHQANSEALIRVADGELYLAKNSGRNQISVRYWDDAESIEYPELKAD